MKTKTGNEFSKFGNFEIQKQKFHSSKKEIDLNKVDTKKIALSEGFAYGKNGSKYFVSCKKSLL